jgi:hypothetical protein
MKSVLQDKDQCLSELETLRQRVIELEQVRAQAGEAGEGREGV